MPASFWTFIAFVVLALIATTALSVGRGSVIKEARKKARQQGLDPDEEVDTFKGPFIGMVTAVWVVAFIPLLVASLAVVPTRNIGIVTTFGRPTGQTLSNGLHLKAPWTKVADMDGAIQNLTRAGDEATTVRLGNNSLATVDNTVRWRIVPEAAPALFMDYRSFDGVKDNLVTRQANAALNDVLGKFDPIASLKDQTNENENTALGDLVAEELRARVGKQIIIEQVIIPVIRFDEQTQKRIDAFNAEVANTKVAQQRQQTAQADAEANRILSDSIKNDPNVVTSRCIDQAISKGISPAGCWPGGSVITGVK